MLLPVTVAFLSGLTLGFYLPYFPLSCFLLLALAGCILTVFELRFVLSPRVGLLLFGSFITGFLYSAVHEQSATDVSLSRFIGRGPLKVRGVVVEPIRHAPERIIMVVAVSEVDDGRGPTRVNGRLRVNWREPDQAVLQGDEVVLTTKIRAPTGMLNPGGFDYAAYLARRHIDAVASVSGPGHIAVLPPASRAFWSLWYHFDGWRERIRQAATATLTGPALALYLGMIIGEPDYLLPEVRDLFMASGTVHILSISGSHLGLIAFLSFFLITTACQRLPAPWLLCLSRRITPTRLAALLTAVPVTLYTLLAGSEVATIRSLIMILLFLLGIWFGRENSLLRALAVAALLIVIHDPHALFEISFQLSYLSVLAIAVVIQRRRLQEQDLENRGGPVSLLGRVLKRVRHYLWSYAVITSSVTVVTLPLVAYYFNQVAWLGLLGNLLVVPLAGFILVPLGLAAAGWLLLTGATTLPAGPFFQAMGNLLVEVVSMLAGVPGAEWHVASPALWSMPTFYLALFVALWPGITKPLRAITAVAAVVLASFWLWSPRPPSDGENLRVTFLDVGQGDACVIELPDGQTVLIDAGAAYDTLDLGRAVVAPYLWDRGITRLDHVIATHPQLDHVGGLPWIIRRFEVGQYWSNGVKREERFYAGLRESLAARGLTERIAQEGQRLIDSESCRLQVLNPPARHPAGATASAPAIAAGSATSGTILNNLSVVTRLDCGPHSFLFTADIETEAISRLRISNPPLTARVLKVPHHGARSSLEQQWIARLKSEVAVVSAGAANPYGHPAPAVLEAYERHGLRLYRTDRHGAVWVQARLSSPEFEVHTAHERLLRPVPVGTGMWEAERNNLHRLWSQWTTV